MYGRSCTTTSEYNYIIFTGVHTLSNDISEIHKMLLDHCIFGYAGFKFKHPKFIYFRVHSFS